MFRRWIFKRLLARLTDEQLHRLVDKARRLALGLALVIVLAASCNGGEYCPDGQRYEWKDIGTTVVPVCVAN